MNHTIDLCWELYGTPSAHQASIQVKELPLESLLPTSKVVSIPKQEYNRLLSMHSNSVWFGFTITLAQQGTSIACLATPEPFGR